MTSLSIQKRIALGFGVVLTVMLAVASVNWLATGTMSGLFKTYRDSAEQSLILGRANTHLLNARNALNRYQINRDVAYIDTMQDEIDRLRATDISAFESDADAQATLDTLSAEATQFAAAGATLVDLNDRRIALQDRLISQSDAVLADLDVLLDYVPYEASMATRSTLDALLKAERFLLSNDAAAADEVVDHLAAATNWAQTMENLIFSDARLEILNRVTAEIQNIGATFTDLRTLSNAETALKRETLGTLGPDMQDQIAGLVARVEQTQEELGADSSATIEASRMQLIGMTAVALALGILAAVLIGRGISRSVTGFARRMEHLADGNLDTDIRRSDASHELARMSNALVVFRDNALEMQRLEAERQAAQTAAVVQREAMMEELRDAFGTVVERSVQGDFSARVTRSFDDDALAELADGLNRLVESVERGVAETNRVVSGMAEGDLRDRMQGDFAGAFADLKRDVNATIAKLAQIVGQIEESGAAIVGDTHKISRDAESLASRTTDQASALEETAATMEQMAATVRANVDSAQKVASLANEAATDARKGSAVVEEATKAMSEINASASKITEIVSVIDDIAFQTNLLALNAAVEAARAGDAGKGFAVVASEVRTLAQRASGSATDIRGLIQRSTGDVSRGVTLVAETGTMLRDLSGSIEGVASVTAEITAASREQSSGVDEISGTVAHMDDITQKNASMADESAQSARALAERADGLQTLLAFFRSGGGAPLAEATQDEAWAQIAAAAPAAEVQHGGAAPARAARSDEWEDF